MDPPGNTNDVGQSAQVVFPVAEDRFWVMDFERFSMNVLEGGTGVWRVEATDRDRGDVSLLACFRGEMRAKDSSE
jgi:hypothetical protein